MSILLALSVPGVAAARPAGPLLPLLDTAADRIEVADLVAAAKFPDQPITDPARERQVLDDAAARGSALGLDSGYVRAFFADQIEAAKVVEYGLFARWTAHPEQAPGSRPDLGEIRARLDVITGRLLHDLVSTTDTRRAPGCPVRLRVAGTLAGVHHHLDALHAAGLRRATPSVCVTG